MKFHVYAMVDLDFASAVLPVVWTVATRGLAGLIIGVAYGAELRP